jgi:hypothetical protein
MAALYLPRVRALVYYTATGVVYGKADLALLFGSCGVKRRPKIKISRVTFYIKHSSIIETLGLRTLQLIAVYAGQARALRERRVFLSIAY